MARRPALGFTVLAIYLLLVGLSHLIHLQFSGFPALLGITAIAAGVLILVGR